MMKMSGNQVVHMVAVRNGFVAAPGSMRMSGFMRTTSVFGRAPHRILPVHRNGVIIDMAFVHMMKMAVMKIVDMTVMFDCNVAAALAVGMSVTLMFDTWSCHLEPSFWISRCRGFLSPPQ